MKINISRIHTEKKLRIVNNVERISIILFINVNVIWNIKVPFLVYQIEQKLKDINDIQCMWGHIGTFS